MEDLKKLRSVIMGIAMAAASCSTHIAEPDSTVEARSQAVSNSTNSSGEGVGDQLPVLQLKLSERDAADISNRLASLCGLFADAGVSAESVRLSEPKPSGLVVARIDTMPTVWAAYERRLDAVSALDTTVTRDTGSEASVDEGKARDIFLSVFQRIAAQGLIEADRFDLARVRLSHVRQGEGRTNEPAVERIKEYVFFVPSLVRGIEMNDAAFHGFGVTVRVHRSGKVSAIKISGMSISDLGDNSVKTVATVERRVASADLDARAAREFAGAAVTPIGLRYAVDGSGNVEPTQTYKVVHESVVDGNLVHSRAQYIHYKIDRADAPASVWPTPEPDAVGDPRP
jgi:hypothetical protein